MSPWLLGSQSEEHQNTMMKGYWAHQAGKLRSQNPFVADDPRHEAWDEGWDLVDILRANPQNTRDKPTEMNMAEREKDKDKEDE